MRIEIEVGLDIVDAFPNCDVERSLMRYADKIADEARERWPDASVSWRIDTQCGFGVRIETGGDEAVRDALREEADRVWAEQEWVVDPRKEALAEHLGSDVTHADSHRYRTSGGQAWLVVTESELVQLDGGFFAYRVG